MISLFILVTDIDRSEWGVLVLLVAKATTQVKHTSI